MRGDTGGSTDHHEEMMQRDATREEIFSSQQPDGGIWSQLDRRGGQLPQTAADARGLPEGPAIRPGEPGIIGDLLGTRRLPISRLSEGSGVEKKNPGAAPQIYDCPAADLYQWV